MDSIDAKILQTLPCYNECKRNADSIKKYKQELKGLLKYDYDWHTVSKIATLSQSLVYAIERSKFLNELLVLEYEKHIKDANTN